MICRDHRIYYEVGQRVPIWTVTDAHIGERNCSMKGLEQWVQRIASDPGPVFVLGDMASYITRTDKRWSSGGIDESVIRLSEIDQLPSVISDVVAEVMMPIRHLIVDWDDGNHEDAINHYCTTNVSVATLTKLNRTDAYSKSGGITTVKLDDGNKHVTSLDVSHTHGHVAGRSDGAKITSLEAESGWLHAHLYLRGHSHSKFKKQATRISKRDSRIVDEDIMLAHCGSWLLTRRQDGFGVDDRGVGINRSSYAERRGYRPTVLGNLRFEVTPYRDGFDLE